MTRPPVPFRGWVRPTLVPAQRDQVNGNTRSEMLLRTGRTQPSSGSSRRSAPYAWLTCQAISELQFVLLPSLADLRRRVAPLLLKVWPAILHRFMFRIDLSILIASLFSVTLRAPASSQTESMSSSMSEPEGLLGT